MRLTYLVFVVFLISLASAQQIPTYQDKYVNDFANVLSSQQVGELRNIFGFVDENTTAEIVFVSISNCSGDPDSYSMQIADNWKPGKKDKDNGLIILYCQTENKVVVKTGYGLEGILPDSKIGRFLDDYYLPQKDSGNVSQGIVDFSKAISEEISKNREEVLSTQHTFNYGTLLIVFIVLVLIALLIYFIRKRDRRGFGDFLVFFFVDFLLRMILYSIFFRRRGSSSSSGGSSGFGGGGFGGGGASR
jgi:uncharacterized protein